MKSRSKISHMLHKLLACWNFALFLFAFGQCDQCTTHLVEDNTKWKLAWHKAVVLGSLLPPVALMQTSGLIYARAASFSGITGQESFFAFPVGSIQAQTLHVDIVN
jgi:hypothetical protein